MKLKIYTGLTLTFINGELKVVHRKGRAYKVHEVQILQELKFNLRKTYITIPDIEQIVSNGNDIEMIMEGNRLTLKNVNLI